MTEVLQLFDRIAPVYDQLNDLLSLGLHRVWKKMVLRWADPQGRWLDLCCGSGDMAILLAKHGVNTIGLDFSESQLAIARLKSPEIAGLTWQLGDALHTPYPDGDFDGITMTYGLRNLADIDSGFAEIYRLLKPQGRAVILDFHLPYDRLMQKFQQWYLNSIVVPTADFYQLKSEYAYLWESLQKFPQGQEQVKKAIKAGFHQAKYYPIGNGMMGILVLNK